MDCFFGSARQSGEGLGNSRRWITANDAQYAQPTRRAAFLGGLTQCKRLANRGGKREDPR
jgi:hypothetical protein